MNFKHLTLSAALAALGLSISAPAQAGQDAYLGEVMLVGFNFCPRGTAEANGQLLPISQNSALFSLLGTMYGGDGRTTFALPDLRGRVPIGVGSTEGDSNYRTGQKGGSEQLLSSGTNTAKMDYNPAGDLALSVDNMQPYLAMKYCIVTQGQFPSRY